MSCTPQYIESANYCTSFDSQVAGWKERVILIPADSISSGFGFQNATDNDSFPRHNWDKMINNGPVFVHSAIVKNIYASGAVVLKPSVSHIELDVVPETLNADFKGVKGGFINTVKFSLQNSFHNRGLLIALKRIRFMLAIQQNADTYNSWEIIGHFDPGGSLRNMARILPNDGIENKSGQQYSDDKEIAITVEAFTSRGTLVAEPSEPWLFHTQEFTSIATAGTVGTGNAALVTNGNFLGDQSNITKVEIGSDVCEIIAQQNGIIPNAATPNQANGYPAGNAFNILASNGAMYWLGGHHLPEKERVAGEKITVYSKVL
ncbi:MAG: hypothetical protein NXI00_10985 [Cytophagales bacterium]|nr:hypothetical protein [Cytophagales bacterium]